MNSFTTHHNLIWHPSEQRSVPTTCESLHHHASWTNPPMSILIISINSILPKYFKSKRAVAFNQDIIVNIYHIYADFFVRKSHYNNNLYKRNEIQVIFDTFGGGSRASWRIKIYGLIFGLEYVYVIYFLNPNGRHVTFLWWRKYNYSIHITKTIIFVYWL